MQNQPFRPDILESKKDIATDQAQKTMQNHPFRRAILGSNKDIITNPAQTKFKTFTSDHACSKAAMASSQTVLKTHCNATIFKQIDLGCFSLARSPDIPLRI